MLWESFKKKNPKTSNKPTSLTDFSSEELLDFIRVQNVSYIRKCKEMSVSSLTAPEKTSFLLHLRANSTSLKNINQSPSDSPHSGVLFWAASAVSLSPCTQQLLCPVGANSRSRGISHLLLKVFPLWLLSAIPNCLQCFSRISCPEELSCI